MFFSNLFYVSLTMLFKIFIHVFLFMHFIILFCFVSFGFLNCVGRIPGLGLKKKGSVSAAVFSRIYLTTIITHQHFHSLYQYLWNTSLSLSLCPTGWIIWALKAYSALSKTDSGKTKLCDPTHLLHTENSRQFTSRSEN